MLNDRFGVNLCKRALGEANVGYIVKAPKPPFAPVINTFAMIFILINLMVQSCRPKAVADVAQSEVVVVEFFLGVVVVGLERVRDFLPKAKTRPFSDSFCIFEGA